MKRSKWFPVSTPPTIEGAYEYSWKPAAPVLFKVWWSGSSWMFMTGERFRPEPKDKWRGLAEKP